MEKLVIIGRGGTGKTSSTALMARYFIEKGEAPLLLVDADPDQNLGEMIGVDLHKYGKKTISELLVETFIDGKGTTYGVTPSEKVESKIWMEAMYEGDLFDFIALGTKWVEGCYCLPNFALKGAIEKLTRNYRFILIDSPAGLEHLNRRITSQVDDVFDIIDPSKKSFDHVNRAYKIAREVKIEFENFYIIGGYRFPGDLADKAVGLTGMKYLGKIAYDNQLENYVLSGKSLFDLPKDSPAYLSIKEILKNAGY